jgi:hypothetical protein
VLYCVNESGAFVGCRTCEAQCNWILYGALLQRQLGQHLARQLGAAWVDLLEVKEAAGVCIGHCGAWGAVGATRYLANCKWMVQLDGARQVWCITQGYVPHAHRVDKFFLLLCCTVLRVSCCAVQRYSKRAIKLEPSTPRAGTQAPPHPPSGDAWRASSINSTSSGILGAAAFTTPAAAGGGGGGLSSPPDVPAAVAAGGMELAPAGSCSSAAVAVGLQRPEHVGAGATQMSLLKHGSGIPSYASSAGGSTRQGPSVGAIREAMTTSSMVEMLRQQVQRSKDRVRDKENRCGVGR